MIHIPVVLATDNRYIPLVVTLMSLIKSADENTFYDIYILTDDDFLDKTQKSIENYFREYRGKCSIMYKNVGYIFDGVSSNCSHITRPTFYRLVIPDLLTEDRCIYLDTDTIIRSDLKELYNTPLDECYVAGVRHAGFILSAVKDELCKKICIPSINQYINAGVLVLNLKEMRKNNLVREFLELLPKNFPTQDQDIINRVCYGKMAFIPFKYNVMTQFDDWCIEDYQDIYSESELKEAWNNPCIIHYASPSKPWNGMDCVFMDYWWEVCRTNKILENIMSDFLNDFVISMLYHLQGSMFTKKLPRNFDIAFKNNCVIYGAGKRARAFISFMKDLGNIPEFIIVSDPEKDPFEVDGIEVKCIDDMTVELKNKTIIIATKQIFHKEIVKNLQKYAYNELLPLSDSWKL